MQQQMLQNLKINLPLSNLRFPFFKQQFLYKSSRKMLNAQQSSNALYLHKIVFNIHKRVKFGQAIYVCGSIAELGNWTLEKALRLKWNQNDRWSANLFLRDRNIQDLQFKYIVADWDRPSASLCLWQKGCHNRKLELHKSAKIIVLDDRWNMDKITLNLHINKRSNAQQGERYYVVGDIDELGVYKQPKIMKRVNSRVSTFKKESLIQAHISNPETNMEIYTFSFHSEKNKAQFNYYYIRKTQIMKKQRKPGRIFNFNSPNTPHPQRINVVCSKGDIAINDYCSLNALKISQITPKIYVGSYPKSLSDIQELKEKGITAIFSIQTQKDFTNHGLSPHYFSLLCEQSGVKCRRYAIQDMNNQDFVSKAQGGLNILKELMKEDKIYVHCSAGIYRSPQMIALYLILCEQYPIDRAIQHLKQNHPYAKPNTKVIKQAIGAMIFKSQKNVYSI